MGFVVVAHTPQDFARWQDSRQPRGGEGGEGLRLFLSSCCAACHTIRGTPANGLAGPDLTHAGSRRPRGAGIMPNNPGTMAGWVAQAHAHTPTNPIPPCHPFSGSNV